VEEGRAGRSPRRHERGFTPIPSRSSTHPEPLDADPRFQAQGAEQLLFTPQHHGNQPPR
jgi:hypothetical protein